MTDPKILEGVRSPDSDIRQRAAVELAAQADPAALEHLFALIGDEDWRVRKTAVDGIAGYPADQVVDQLIRALRDGTNAGRRNSATEALMRFGPQASGTIIETLRNESDPDVRLSLINLLGDIRSDSAFELLVDIVENEEDVNIASGAAAAVGRYRKPEAIPPLRSALARNDPWLDFHVIEALGEIGDRAALPAILQRYEERSLRKAVLDALANIADVGTVNFLVRIIREEEKLNLQALRTLVAIADADKPRLIKRSELDLIRRHAREAFDPGKVALLIDHLRSTSKKDVRLFIIRILGWSGVPSAVPVLIESSRDPDLTEAAVQALVEFGPGATPEIYAALESAQDDENILTLLRAASSIGGDDLQGAVIPWLDHPSPGVRRASIEILGSSAGAREANYLLAMLDDASPEVQQAAVDALVETALEHTDVRRQVIDRMRARLEGGEISSLINALQVMVEVEGEGYDDELARAAHSPEASVREKALALMGRFGDDRFEQTLTLALADEATSVRLAAIRAIVRSRPDAGIAPLISSLGDEDIWIRTAAAQALGEYGATEAIEPLTRQLEEKIPPVRIAAIEALGKLAGPGVKEPLLSMLKVEDPEVQKAALIALAKVEGDDVLEAIVRELGSEDWGIRAAAAQALGNRGSAKALPALHELFARETDPFVRQSVAGAMVAMGDGSSIEYLLSALQEPELVDEVSEMFVEKGVLWKAQLERAWKSADNRVEPVIAAILAAIREASEKH